MASPGRLYILQHNTSHYYKIGLTRGSIVDRIAKLQTGNPYRIYPRLVIDMPDMRIAETILHRKYIQHRGIGEWFYFDPKHDKYPENIENVLAYIRDELIKEVEHRLLLKDMQI